ncbi:hypothetical protein HMPREF0645_1432 [Hallella bergensis DSM 17361]|uniref:Uncharacterized protein n=1 Tax=Hallella bergensis DSM 17361 TaxID=585502 RepID=D1PWU7_9BACT|nr:hypothetical protein HMPREF0645_1432 [Hallella bergensis DSM 17361]
MDGHTLSSPIARPQMGYVEENYLPRLRRSSASEVGQMLKATEVLHENTKGFAPLLFNKK